VKGMSLVAAELFRRMGDADQVLRAIQAEAERRRCDWPSRARGDQLLPLGDWIVWLILAGRGWGKTRTGAETVRHWNAAGHRYVNLIGATSDDARDIMIEGESGILACCPRDRRPHYRKSERKLMWPNGAESLIFTADEPERLRGKQHGKLWCDELASWRYPESWDQAQFGLRLGSSPQAVVTTTPRPTKIIKELAADETTHLTEGTTYDNRANLAKAFFDKVIKKYEGTRLGRQELHAKILDDNPRALWTRSVIEASRVKCVPAGVTLSRIVTAVDPAVTSSTTSDDTGIVVEAIGSDGHLYVLADNTQSEATPAQWASRAVRSHFEWKGDRIVGEVNNGGDLVEMAIRAVVLDDGSGKTGAQVPYTKVTATRGKAKRAEPISALWEQGRAHIVGSLPELEDEMCSFDPTIDPDKQPSPNRMDAMVWGGHMLMEPSTTGLIDHYAREAARLKQEKQNA
jgi:phage terminase large subunit-like protein